MMLSETKRHEKWKKKSKSVQEGKIFSNLKCT